MELRPPFIQRTHVSAKYGIALKRKTLGKKYFMSCRAS